MVGKPLEGKTALITGACRNLGAVTAKTLARSGANIVINDLDIPDAITAIGKPAGDRKAGSLLRHDDRHDAAA
jgi:NAD(P)-dependent dehydrogenase (short-subunit alcohol dehydrogenase family)